MGPLGHLVVGYVLYSGLTRLRGLTPRDRPTIALVFGTQFPDLVDKPLAWSFAILPNGRSLAHSLITAMLLIFVLHLVCRRYEYSSLSTAFAIGYLSHLAGDVLASALVGEYRYYYLGFLAWPLVPAIAEGEKSLLAQLSVGRLAALSTVEVGIVVLVVVLWVFDGTPGVRPLITVPRRMYRWFVRVQ